MRKSAKATTTTYPIENHCCFASGGTPYVSVTQIDLFLRTAPQHPRLARPAIGVHSVNFSALPASTWDDDNDCRGAFHIRDQSGAWDHIPAHP